MSRRNLSLVLLFMSALPFGCADSKRAEKIEAAKELAAARGKETPATWWCETHGVPKSICAQCDSKLAEAAKAKGDWCSEHQRPKSQCFLCEPRLERKFMAMKNARFGKPAQPETAPGG